MAMFLSVLKGDMTLCALMPFMRSVPDEYLWGRPPSCFWWLERFNWTDPPSASWYPSQCFALIKQSGSPGLHLETFARRARCAWPLPWPAGQNPSPPACTREVGDPIWCRVLEGWKISWFIHPSHDMQMIDPWMIIPQFTCNSLVVRASIMSF